MAIRVLPALIVLVGLSLVAFGYVIDAEPKHHSVTVGEWVESGSVPAAAQVVAVDDLDPTLRDAVRESLEDGYPAGVDALPDSPPEYVRHEGQVFRIETSTSIGEPVLQQNMTAVGSLVAFCGLLVWVGDRLYGEN